MKRVYAVDKYCIACHDGTKAVTLRGDQKLTWLFTRHRSDGTIGLWESRYALQGDGTLLFQGVRLLDDGSRQEVWNMVLKKK